MLANTRLLRERAVRQRQQGDGVLRDPATTSLPPTSPVVKGPLMPMRHWPLTGMASGSSREGGTSRERLGRKVRVPCTLTSVLSWPVREDTSTKLGSNTS